MSRAIRVARVAVAVTVAFVLSSPMPAAAGPQGVDEVTQLLQRAVQAQIQGKIDEAVPLGEQALALAEKQFGAESPLLATPRAIVAGIYSAKGDFAKSEPLFLSAIVALEKVFGPEHPNLAITLVGAAGMYSRKGDYAKSEALYRRALAIYEKALGPEHGQVGDTLTSLARVLGAKGDDRAGLPLLERALRIAEKIAGADSAEASNVLDQLAQARLRLADYAEAEPIARRALAAREKAYGPDHQLVANSVSTLASILYEKGDYRAAESLYRRSLEITERAMGPESTNAATVAYDLASLYDELGRYGKARDLFERALAIREKAYGPDHPEVAQVLNGLALLHDNLGDYSRAEALHRRALAIHERALGPDHPRVALSLNNLGQIFKTRGDYTRAEAIFQKSLEIYERAYGPDHPKVAEAVQSLATLAHSKGDYARAERFYARTLAIREKTFGPSNVQVAITLNNLGLLASDMKDRAKARGYYERALAVFERALGPGHVLTATAANNVATLDLEAGDFVAAERRLRRVLAEIEKKFGPDHLETATPLNNLASALYDRNNAASYAKAEALYRRSLAIYERGLGPDHPSVAVALNNLVALYEATGSVDRALELLTRANEIRERHLSLTLGAGSEQQKRLFLATLAPETEASVSLHVQFAPRDARARDLALTTILRRKGRALDATAASVDILRRSAAPEDRALVDELEEVRSRLAQLVLRGEDAADGAAYRAEVASLAERVDGLEAKIGMRSAEFRSLTQSVTLDAVRAAVPEGAALVEYFAYRPYRPVAKRGEHFGVARYVAYVLAPSGELSWVDLGEAAPIDAAVETMRASVRDPNSDDVKANARALDELIFQPVRALLGKAQTLFVSPDGALNLVPFAALVDESGAYAVERYTIGFLTSGRDLLRPDAVSSNAPRSQGAAPVIVAAPSYGEVGSGGAETPTAMDRLLVHTAGSSRAVFPPLPGTASEAREIESLLGNATVLTGARATEGAVKALDRPTILHVATHGFFLPRPFAAGKSATEGGSPLLRSGLAFAGANGRDEVGGAVDDDGILTALEAAGLRLSGTRLVVLSACDTGVGEVTVGEGVYGLRRALVLAGSESQVMSLWPVSDEGTRELMVAFYRALRDGAGRTEGLRAAQLGLLANAERAHPFYWASFILSGKSGPLDLGPPPAKVAPAATAAVAAIAILLDWSKDEAKLVVAANPAVKSGARVVVDGKESFALELKKKGQEWRVKKSATSTPGGRTLAEIWSDGKPHQVVVENADGTRVGAAVVDAGQYREQ